MNRVSVATKGNGFRGLLARITPFRQFAGTSLSDAVEILGRRSVHTINDVCEHLRLSIDKFVARNQHLLVVPYKVERLESAAHRGAVLTLDAASVGHVMQAAGDEVTVAQEVQQKCAEDMCGRQPSWRLVLREAVVWTPQSQPKDLEEVRLALALSTAYLDFRVHGIRPHEFRRTSTTLTSSGGVDRCAVICGKTLSNARGSAIRVTTCHSDAEYPLTVAWKPHPIRL